jgi:hypothetical protein
MAPPLATFVSRKASFNPSHSDGTPRHQREGREAPLDKQGLSIIFLLAFGKPPPASLFLGRLGLKPAPLNHGGLTYRGVP